LIVLDVSEECDEHPEEADDRMDPFIQGRIYDAADDHQDVKYNLDCKN
jgi:hypothetical protein